MNDPILLSQIGVDCGCDQEQCELLSLPPPQPAKRAKLDAARNFHDETSERDALDFAVQILQKESRGYDPQNPCLDLLVVPHRRSIGWRASESKTQICATVKASELPLGESCNRASVDIVVALDVSGSMRVEKLDLCKKTISLLLRELHHNDRFCLISFSDDAKIEVPMLNVSDEQKLIAAHAIEQIQVRGRTNIACALSLATEVANGIKNPNKVRSVFLLTDGNENVNISDISLLDLTRRFVKTSHGSQSQPISLHTFGYGSEPDSKLLMSMARLTPGGSFYSVRDNSQIASAFGDALGGVLSVVAQQVTLTITIPAEALKGGVEILDIHYDKKTKISDGIYQVDIGDMYAEETRDVIFEVSLMNLKTFDDYLNPIIPHAVVELSYFDTIKHTSIGPLSCAALIARPNNNDISWPNCYVAQQWMMRVHTTKAIADAWHLEQMGDLDSAKEKLSNWIDEFQKEKFEIGSNEPILDHLLKDLTDCLEMLKKTNYDAYIENELGVSMQAHLTQRCSEPIGKRSVYRTAAKTLRARKFERHL